MAEQVTDLWSLYENGISYKRELNLYETVDKNERFFAGSQWEGVRSNGLPTPVLNIIKRVIQYKISQIMSNNVKMQYTVEPNDFDPETALEDALLKQVSEYMSQYSATMWERLKMDSMNLSMLKDAALSGDGVIYFYWDDSIDAGGGVKGDVSCELIDNVNYFPGNPNDPRVQKQPYIILAYRKLVSDLKEEAKANGASKLDIDSIVSDEEYEEQAGDLAKIELDGTDKAICLLKMWKDKKTGTVWFSKKTRTATIKPDTDTNRKLYPVAMMNWEERKNSCHGQADVTGLIDNQIAINKLASMLIMSVMHTAFPKLIYDASQIKAPTNAIGEQIPITAPNGDVRTAAAYLTPGQTSSEVYKLLDSMISYTKEMMGASEVALGEIRPENTSAFIAVNQASAVPLESVKRRFYQYIEDIGRIWLDFWLTNYNTPRRMTIGDNMNQVSERVDMSQFSGLQFKLKIDVGPSTQWSEITSIQTLDALLKGGYITLDQYLERIPNGIIPKRQELLDQIREQMMQQQMMQQNMTQQQLAELMPVNPHNYNNV